MLSVPSMPLVDVSGAIESFGSKYKIFPGNWFVSFGVKTMSRSMLAAAAVACGDCVEHSKICTQKIRESKENRFFFRFLYANIHLVCYRVRNQ